MQGIDSTFDNGWGKFKLAVSQFPCKQGISCNLVSFGSKG